MEALTGPIGRAGLAALALLGLVGVAEGLRSMGVRSTTTRGIVHIGVAGFLVSTPFLFQSAIPVAGLAVAFTTVNAVTRALGWWGGTHGGRNESLGTVTFPLSVVPCLALTWAIDPGRTHVFQVAYLILGVADPVASWTGAWAHRRMTYRGGREQKSIPGSASFFVAALLGSAAFFAIGVPVAPSLNGPAAVVGAAGAIAAVTTIVEGVSRRGWDNFFIPLAAASTLLIGQASGIGTLWAGLLGGALFGLGAYRARLLTPNSACVAGLLAASLIAGGGGPWLVPGLVFFVLSSGISRLPRWIGHEGGHRAESEGARSLEQVLANGGVAWMCLIGFVAWPTPVWYVAALGAFAAAAADTWATELGTWLPSRARSLRTAGTVPPGTSGAVSVVGTAGAAVGAATVVIAAWLTRAPIHGPTLLGGMQLVGAGLVGMVVDGLVGATIQAQYGGAERGPPQDEAPHPGAVPVRGWPIVNNETVNVIGTMAGAVAALLFWAI